MLQLMYICNNPSLAILAVKAGVNRIFVDLEIMGKFERQGHLNTLISCHTLEDVKAIRRALPSIDLLVRINPYHDKTKQEIKDVLQFNPQMIMLPMYKDYKEVRKASDFIDGQAELIPLLETPQALYTINEVSKIPGVTEVYMGLNDLHLALGLKFMFLLLSDGTVEKVSKIVKENGKRFGFGGIARIGEGQLPAESILGEHERLGSSSVILSRTFHRELDSVSQIGKSMDFSEEVKKIRLWEEKMARRSDKERYRNREDIHHIIEEIISHVPSY